MPRYYCDYCDTYLTHDSPSVRKQHNAGYKHKANVRNYYAQFEDMASNPMMNEKARHMESHSREAFQAQVGAAFQQRIAAMRPPMGAGPPPGGPPPPMGGFPPQGMPPPYGGPPHPGMGGPPPGWHPPPQGYGVPPPGMGPPHGHGGGPPPMHGGHPQPMTGSAH
uniref:U1 small nuclear ribonucleoprotein C n=2 Tax=Tetraselmis sp. GSL018 TaxID=582737 RepID=A0A061SA94_9CHLO|mmetsp:Transcript_5248/g.12785  ORF Transcript_5248/g.12785 Transcript_5248/m.12785 type:complete len:165 (-) Transcript_5248:81-575(-)